MQESDNYESDAAYSDDEQRYHFGGAARTIHLEAGDRGWMYSVPEIGISAGCVILNGVHLSFNGELFITGYDLVHKPDTRPFGTIEIRAPQEDQR